MLKKIKKISLALIIMFISSTSLAGEILKTQYNVKKGDNVIKILQNNYINKKDINELIYNTKKSGKINNLKIGQKLTIYKDKKGNLKKLLIELSDIDVLVVTKNKSDGFDIKKGQYKTYLLSLVFANLLTPFLLMFY